MIRNPGILSGLSALLLLSACVQKMGKLGHLQPYELPRLAPEGTVARGHLPSPLDDPTLKKIPLPVNAALLERGRQRFEIYCTPCHGYAGYGDGMVVRRGFITPPSYHAKRVRTATDGHIYRVIRDGFGAMYSYGDRVNVRDRWAIVAYIRALELSQACPVSRLTEQDRAALAKVSEKVQQ